MTTTHQAAVSETEKAGLVMSCTRVPELCAELCFACVVVQVMGRGDNDVLAREKSLQRTS